MQTHQQVLQYCRYASCSVLSCLEETQRSEGFVRRLTVVGR